MTKPDKPLSDLKEALGNRLKPDITHVRYPAMVYTARGGEYGDDKYQRGNYLRPVADTKAAFIRYRSYMRAVIAHGVKNLDAMEKHLSLDPDLEDEDGMRAAVFAPDTEQSSAFPASGLPHVSHMSATLNMVVTQAVDAGLLPADPGCPWLAPRATDTANLEEVFSQVVATPTDDPHIYTWYGYQPKVGDCATTHSMPYAEARSIVDLGEAYRTVWRNDSEGHLVELVTVFTRATCLTPRTCADGCSCNEYCTVCGRHVSRHYGGAEMRCKPHPETK